jgi:hypothetical protein
MSSYQVPVSEERRGQFQYDSDDAHGQGLVTFAGVMLLLAGTLNLVFGAAAIDGARFFTEDTEYVIGDLGALGWFVVILGVLQIAAAFAVWRAVPWGRWFGVACAFGNAFLQMLWIPAHPIVAMALLTIDVIVMWALLAYGGRRAAYLRTR